MTGEPKIQYNTDQGTLRFYSDTNVRLTDLLQDYKTKPFRELLPIVDESILFTENIISTNPLIKMSVCC